MPKNHLKKILKNKYGSFIKRENIAHELGVAYSTITQYTEFKQLRQNHRYYSTEKFIDTIYQNRTIIKNRTKYSQEKYFQILYWLYDKFEKLIITKDEYLKVINYKFQLSRLNDKIKNKDNIPSYYKYRSFGFIITDVARFLSTQVWFNIPISQQDCKLNYDTLRFTMKNFDANRLLTYFRHHGYSIKEYAKLQQDSKNQYIYKYEIYYSKMQKNESCMFRLTKSFTKTSLSRVSVSIEFFGLKTYNDSLDQKREQTLKLFLSFVNDYNLHKFICITKIDLAFDFRVNKSQIQLFHTKKEVNPKYQYYQTDSANIDLIPKNIISKANVINLTNNTNNIMKHYIDDGYDIVITNRSIKIAYSFLESNKFTGIKYLKLKRLKNRVYDKAKKANISDETNLTRVEFTLTKTISYNDFNNPTALHAYLKEELKNYYLYINTELYQLTNSINLNRNVS